MPLNQKDHGDQSWWTLSEGWPETREHAHAKWVFANKAQCIPYGSYVLGGDAKSWGPLRVENRVLLDRLNEYFGIVRQYILEGERAPFTDVGFTPLEYSYNAAGNFQLPDAAPFDGKLVMIQVGGAAVYEAFWNIAHDGGGFAFVCPSDNSRIHISVVSGWKPLPRAADLTFSALRAANIARIPQFKNSRGEPAHTTRDGSDWTPAQWLQAVVGELGELAEVRVLFEEGKMSMEEYQIAAAKEIADVQIYLDIAAMRLLDKTEDRDIGMEDRSSKDPAQVLMAAVRSLGQYANLRKKFERGDIGMPLLRVAGKGFLLNAAAAAQMLIDSDCLNDSAMTVAAHPTGIDLGRATIDKFNYVSVRVGSDVKL